MRAVIAFFSLCGAGLLAGACASGPQPVLSEPQSSIAAMRDAWEKDDVDLFLHTLSRPVKNEYSEYTIRVGWTDVRPLVGDFIQPARVVDMQRYVDADHDPATPSGYVWPEASAELVRVRLDVEGLEEDFLFQREVDPPPLQSKQARGFWIGDRWIVVTEHPSPGTYLTSDSPEGERTHWRLVFPYYPFQADGALTRKLQQQLAENG